MAQLYNIIGYPLPKYVFDQLNTRSSMLSKDVRDSENLVFLANRTGWVRVVSGIDGAPGANAEDFVLFGGTSAYKSAGNYALRGGLKAGGSYGLLGDSEISNYGFRPFMGLTSVKVSTQGPLGTQRKATISFKATNLQQLDIAAALFFKLGFSVFVEWGSTFFYPNGGGVLSKGEDYCVDPFSGGTFTSYIKQMKRNSESSCGNYDGFVALITNYNYSLNNEGIYDCTVDALAPGVMLESLRINTARVYGNFLIEEVRKAEEAGTYTPKQDLATGTVAGSATQAPSGTTSPTTTTKPASSYGPD